MTDCLWTWFLPTAAASLEQSAGPLEEETVFLTYEPSSSPINKTLKEEIYIYTCDVVWFDLGEAGT